MSNCHVEVYSRVTGYFSPTSQWNKGKREEFGERKHFKVTEDTHEPITEGNEIQGQENEVRQKDKACV